MSHVEKTPSHEFSTESNNEAFTDSHSSNHKPHGGAAEARAEAMKICEIIRDFNDSSCNNSARQSAASDPSGHDSCNALNKLDSGLQGKLSSFCGLLDLPEVEPPENLIDATLDGCLIIWLQSSESADQQARQHESHEPLEEQTSTFRSSVEFLTRMPLISHGAPVTPGMLVLRVLFQAAAAVFLFAAVSGFWSIFQPAYAWARASSIDSQVQSQLKRLHLAAIKYKLAVNRGDIKRPSTELEFLRGRELADQLITYGFAQKSDFLCPGVPKARFGSIHFIGCLSFKDTVKKMPLFWDRFSNHETHINVVFHDGTVLSYNDHDFVKLFR